MNDIRMDGVPPFIVLALPRSRTAWLSKFLSYRPWICGHDQIRYLRSLDDVKCWFRQPYIGSAETGGSLYWRLIRNYAPDARVLVVRRPVLEVLDSIARLNNVGLDMPSVLANLRRIDSKLDQIEMRLPNVISVNFDELNDVGICRIVFEHCLTLPFDESWWEFWNQVNVQVDFEAVIRYVWAHAEPMARLAYRARHQMMADLVSQPVAKINDGLTIQEESYDSSFVDAQDLFERHCVSIGELPDEWTRSNWTLMRQMDAAGMLQVLTARSNGKMYGYLVSILGTNWDSANQRQATHTLFYADRQFPGAGLRLQREALHRLKQKGIVDVMMRSGLGSAGRIEVLYKRLGAEPDGHLFRLRLEQ